MGLFSFSRKNQQQSSTGSSDFYSQADEKSPASRKRRQGKKREEAVDPLLPQKKRARRRLIGAVALVLAVIIGLPMILDSEPKPLSSDIAIQIPSKDTPALHTQNHAQNQLQPTTKSADTSPNENTTLVKTAPALASETATTTATKVEQTAQSASPAEIQATKAKSPTPTPKTMAAEPTAKADIAAEAEKKAEDAARARAILEGKTPPTSAAKSSSKVVVQVAALTTQEKVDELQKKLKDVGLKSYTEKVKTASGVWIRVRIGPFASDADAEKVRAKLVKIGLNGKLLPA